MPLNAALPQKSRINNAFYDDLGDRWYLDDSHAVALLRAESRLKLAYVREVLAGLRVKPPARILDIACGAGFIAIPLAEDGFHVTGIDLSAGSLAAGKRRSGHLPHCTLKQEDALHLEAADGSFDAVLLLDFLEHVTRPDLALSEAFRVLKPGGILVVHTFNRTALARLLAIKAIELLSRDCPEHLHVYELFLKPREVAAVLEKHGTGWHDLRGIRPDFSKWDFWRSLALRRVLPGFSFVYSRSLAVSYIGYGIKPKTT